MNSYFSKIFDGYKPDCLNLVAFGFKKINTNYIFEKNICNEEFLLKVIIDNDNCVHVKVYDNYDGEEYVLINVNDATGKFVGNIRKIIEAELIIIRDKCFCISIYKNNLTQKLINYAKNKYDCNPEFLWKTNPNYCVLRRPDNNKWYAVIMVINAQKLGFKRDQFIEIVDFRKNKDENIIDNTLIFPAYHMNKQSWYTVVLGDNIENQIYEMLDKSYILAKGKNHG